MNRSSDAFASAHCFPIESMLRVSPEDVRSLLVDIVGEHAMVESLTAESRLYGAIPDFDSIAIVNLMLAIEDRFDVIIEDDEVEESVFASFGALVAFVDGKVNQREERRQT